MVRHGTGGSPRRAVWLIGATAALTLVVAACAGRSLAQDAGVIATSRPATAIPLGSQPTVVELVAAPGPPGQDTTETLAERLRALAADRDVYLTLVDVDAPAQPGITYNVFLVPEGAPTPSGADDPHYAGTLSFFNVGSGPRDVSFNVTDLLARASATKTREARWQVLVVPAGTPETSGHCIAQVVLTTR